MHPHVEHVATLIHDTTAELGAAVAAIPSDLRRTRPVPDRWSAAEIVEHLALVSRMFTARLAPPIAAARAAGLGDENAARHPVPAPMADAMANRGAPRPAPERARPGGAMDDVEAMAALERAHAEFLDLLISVDGRALSAVTYTHAVFGTLDVYQWGELLARHERRHIEQVRELAAQLASG